MIIIAGNQKGGDYSIITCGIGFARSSRDWSLDTPHSIDRLDQGIIMNNYVVYKHTSPSGKSYIGITNNYRMRCYKHNHISNQCTAFANAIKKYGWENFTHTILKENISVTEANYWEGYFIEKDNTFSPNGYNLKTGGNFIMMSDETKKKLSIINTGKKHTEEAKLKVSMAARNMSDETKAKMSASQKVKVFTKEHRANISAAKKGMAVSAETRQKLSIINTGKKLSSETIEKMVKTRMGRPDYRESIEKAATSRMNPIVRSDGVEFKGMKSAAFGTGCSVAGISHVLHGRQKAIRGFSFKFKAAQE